MLVMLLKLMFDECCGLLVLLRWNGEVILLVPSLYKTRNSFCLSLFADGKNVLQPEYCRKC